MKATFDDESFGYVIDGAEVDQLTAKGASDSIARESKIAIRRLAQQLQNEQISLQDFYDGMKRETKYLQALEVALARGGIENMREEDWERAGKLTEQQWNGVEGQFPGLRAFAEDIQKGRYGKGTQPLSSAVLARAGQYADSGRSVYENERLAAQMEKYPLEAKRIMSATQHCESCRAWAALGWIDAQEMYAQYPIGASECGVSCYCFIVTRRKAVDDAQEARSHWKALPAVLTNLARAGAATGAVAIVALSLLRVARSNPTLVQIALRLLAGALGV